jgi:hypothetical protein
MTIGAILDVRLLTALATVAAFGILLVYVLAGNGRPRSLTDWLPVVGVVGLLVAASVAALTGPTGADDALSGRAVDEATWLTQVRALTRRALTVELMLAVPFIVGCVGLLVAAARPGNPGRLRRRIPAVLTGISALLVAAIAVLVIWNLVDSAPAANEMDRAGHLLSIVATVPRLVALLVVAAAAAWVVDRRGPFDLAVLAGSALLVVSAAQPVLLRGGYATPPRPDTIYAVAVRTSADGIGAGIDGTTFMAVLVPLAAAALLVLAAIRRRQAAGHANGRTAD